jgi:nucleoid-associated protein YgaU
MASADAAEGPDGVAEVPDAPGLAEPEVIDELGAASEAADGRLAADDAHAAEAEAAALATVVSAELVTEGEPEAEPEAEPDAAAEPAAAEQEPEGEPEPDAEPDAEPAGWFRDDAIDGGADDQPGAPEPFDTEVTVAIAPVEAEDVVLRDRDRDEAASQPDGGPPRRPSRLRGILIGLVTIVAVGAVGFVAGLLLPTVIPGPGIESVTPGPSATPDATSTPMPTATPVPTATPTPEPTPSPTAEPTPGPTPVTYVVKAGDTLLSIAERYGVTAAAIQRENDISDPNLIRVGQRLTIPAP